MNTPSPYCLNVVRISTEEWGFQDAMHEVDVLDFVLKEVNYGDTCLHKKSEKHLLRLIERNGGALFDSLFNTWND